MRAVRSPAWVMAGIPESRSLLRAVSSGAGISDLLHEQLGERDRSAVFVGFEAVQADSEPAG
jgi:hypothetical protein